ncbi:MAG: caspase family protein [Planctomycetes bacterium]|nr:caspase family protein [Planctomycetota bacterium]
MSSDDRAWEPREYAIDQLPLDAKKVQRRLATVAGLALGSQVALLGGETAADPVSAAEASNAEVLLKLDLLQSRVSWVGRDGLWWWADLFLFWGLGVWPVVFVPDEVYEYELRARLQAIEVRSGRSVHTEEFSVSYRRSLNHAQRGWSVGGLLWLHPYTLSEEDLAFVGQALWPQVANLLERHVATTLVEEVHPKLKTLLPQIQDGSLGPRLRALVVGLNDSASGEQVRLDGAERDAESVAEHLRACGVNPTLLSGRAASREGITEALRELAGHLRGRDRLLVYFAGFGTTDSEGKPALVTADGPLPLRELSDGLARWIPPETRVDLVIDASFGALAGGRTLPGGTKLARSSLGVLVKGRPWRLICAARPEETAIEGGAPGQGLFTKWLVTLAKGTGDANGDGTVSLREAWEFLSRWLTPEAREAGAEQRPCIWGGDYDLPFFPIPSVLRPRLRGEDMARSRSRSGSALGDRDQGSSADQEREGSASIEAGLPPSEPDSAQEPKFPSRAEALRNQRRWRAR